QRRGRYLVTTLSPSDLQLPEQVTVAIAVRTRGLSDGCRRALTLASCLGDNFSLQTLSVVSGVSEDELLDLLEEGMRQRLLLSGEQTFSSPPPATRFVFYHEPAGVSRQRIHLQTARPLDLLYAANLNPPLLEIFPHLRSAAPIAEEKKIVQYARR